MTQFVYGLRLKNCIQPWMPPYFNLFSIRAGSPLFSPPRFLTVIENLRPPFLSLSLSLSSLLPFLLFFFFNAIVGRPRCRHLHRAAVERSPRRWIIVSFLSGSWHSSRHVSLFSWRNSFLSRLERGRKETITGEYTGHRTLTLILQVETTRTG